MTLSRPNLKKIASIKRFGEKAAKYTPILRTVSRLATLTGVKPLRHIGHALRAAYLVSTLLRGLGAARQLSKKAKQPAGKSSWIKPSPKPKVGKKPTAGGLPAASRWIPKVLPVGPSPKPLAELPQTPKAAPPVMLKQSQQPPYQFPAGPAMPAAFPHWNPPKTPTAAPQVTPNQASLPEADDAELPAKGGVPKSIPMASAERRTLPMMGGKAKPITPSVQGKATPFTPAPQSGERKKWMGWQSNDRDKKGRFTPYEKPGWGQEQGGAGVGGNNLKLGADGLGGGEDGGMDGGGNASLQTIGQNVKEILDELKKASPANGKPSDAPTNPMEAVEWMKRIYELLDSGKKPVAEQGIEWARALPGLVQGAMELGAMVP